MEKVEQRVSLEELIKIQFEELMRPERYPGLRLKQNSQSLWVIFGQLHFRARDKRAIQADIIDDRVEIELTIPQDYPDMHPIVKVTDGRIPSDYPHVYKDGRLCLGTPTEVLIIFAENRTLLHFIEDQVIEYLYGFCYWEAHGEMPWKDRSHGALGILEFYGERFGYSDPRMVLKFLYFLATCRYGVRNKCPCGSKKKIRVCHINQLKPFIVTPKPKALFDQDIFIILKAFEQIGSREQFKRVIENIIPDYYYDDLKEKFSSKEVIKQGVAKGEQLDLGLQ